MNKKDLDEAMTATNTVVVALLATLQGSTGISGATLKYLCGQFQANGRAELNSTSTRRQFWIDFAGCFEAAQQAGATFTSMDAVRAAAEALVVIGLPAIAVKNFATRMALAEEARIIAATTYVSRQDVDAIFDVIDCSFDRAELIAADNRDNVAYQLLISIHAAVSNDLATRSRPLPQMITYSYPEGMPALALAQRIYQDGSRSDELVAENKPIHPLFMPSSGNALSS